MDEVECEECGAEFEYDTGGYDIEHIRAGTDEPILRPICAGEEQ